MSDKHGAPTLPPLGGGGGNDGESKAGAPEEQLKVSVQQVLVSADSGQQIAVTPQNTSHVLQTTSGTTSQPAGVTRIVNLAGTSPRVGVVNVSDPTTSPGRQNPKLVLTTSPKLVRTPLSNMIVAPSSQISPSQSPPPKKKLKLDESGTEKVTEPADPMGYRRRIIEHKLRKMLAIRDQYNEYYSELFFLQNGGDITDYYVWREQPPSAEYLEFMKEHRLETDTDEEEFQSLISETETSVSVTVTTSGDTATTPSSPTASVSQSTKVTESESSSVAVSTDPIPVVMESIQEGELPKDIVKTEPISVDDPVTDTEPVTNPVEKPVTPPISSAQPVVKLVKLSASSIASSCDTSSNSQEQIVEKAKQEAYVMQRVAELQREGLWSERRLPKIQEPPRPKAHWDYLLEEMVWLSTDFAQERKWKKAAAKRCARMVQKHFQEKALQAQKAEKLEELRLRKIASFIAKEIKTFWTNVEKLVEFKQNTRLEEKRKKALDQHLNFIVNQTEKYSSWVTEGLNKPEGNLSTPASIHSSRISSPIPTERNSDDDFKPNQCSDDDEETIAKAEEEMASNHKEEVELLQKESELPLEDLLKELPPNYLEEREKSLPMSPREVVEKEADDSADAKDTEFTLGSDASSEDEEDTIQEQEKLEKNVDHKQEIQELEAENEMSIDELRAKYANMPATPMNVDDAGSESDEAEEDVEDEDEDDTETEHESESDDETKADSQTQSDEEPVVGLKSLLEDLSDENPSSHGVTDKQTEMDSVAAIAESIQPKGNTLLTTSVVTKIPFLLKHTLREYQHIGLDWLVTMYERKLNGILADEMGLGKTIQTIALLAHLACEKGNWGPHLIVVPTSVMLNWEMECKKWCPGFKILTYYGSQKDRKLKRTGWTKPNAFHICITSYKLVIQDHASFRRKKWKYLILDEAQNIKNFKSQRWQLLLNFQTQRRLLLTGTPLQNNLMELWSLMHFLMPNVFQSHREFKEWFSNPVTGMIEGNSEYNENIIRRLHKVLRPFLLRRLKSEVEKQMPKKYEHVVMCRLSKRQRYLYDDFMSRAKTKETLESGNLLSVINVLMQLRKVCNHPNLFEVRPTVSPFQMEGLDFHTASLAWSALDYDPFKHIDLSCLNLQLIDLEFMLTAFVAHRMRKLKTPRKLIEEIDTQPDPPPRCPSGKIKINVRLSSQPSKPTTISQHKSQAPQQIRIKSFPGIPPTPRVGTASVVKATTSQAPTGQSVTLKVANGQPLQGFSLQLVTHQSGVKAIPVGTGTQNIQTTATVNPTPTGKHGESVPKNQTPSFAQLVQTPTGRHIILSAPNQQNSNSVSFPVITGTGQRLHVLSKPIMTKVIGGVVTTSAGGTGNRPVMRVPPLNVSTSQTSSQTQPSTQLRDAVNKSVKKVAEKTQVVETPKSEFHMPALEEARRKRRQAKLALLANLNERRCTACPVFGEDVFETLQIKKPSSKYTWHNGWLNCASINEPMRTRRQYFSHTNALKNAIKPVEQIVEELSPVFDRYVVYVPAAQAPMPRFHVSHPAPSKLWADQRLRLELQQHLSPKIAQFHPVTRNMMTQFPEPRLIQYDCGKLQSLDRLLRNLKSGNHRVLIFTQMTRMLDVLEAFLNYHGYIYLRLDGATRVDQRQVLMERFNNDKRIFVFILSTRSGGIGVNLTGADTVVFYDSDWNPTMDAQAQDRCHRIGQTRDVHIYRLISERTVEENILKKANQKRLLGDLAIEGGNFTTAYFKSSTIQDLFDVDQTETDASMRMAEILDQNKDREKILQKDTSQLEDRAAMGALENAFAAVEEDLDIQAAKTAKAEAAADLAEFDEDIPVEDGENDEQISKAELEVRNVVSQLTPVERYAMRFVEDSDGNFSAAQLAAAERELEEQKKEWELDRLRAMREEEERQARLTDDDENPITFTREDSQNQIWLSDNTMEHMPMWCPPTPPTSDNDVYIDYSLGFLYENTPMSESQLPPIYVRKEQKRSRIDTSTAHGDGRRPAKVRHKEESVYAPRSLFDRPSPAVSKMRRDMKMHKYRGMSRPPISMPGVKTPSMMKGGLDQEPALEWTIHEDWALLQAIQIYQGLPLNLMILSPGHTPNWDLVADIVNNTSRIYRSPKQCRSRYETVIVPREEGKLLYDTTPKKQKKQKGVYKIPQVSEQQTKTNRPMRTSQLYNQDKNISFTTICSQRFDSIKIVASKRSPTVKALLVNPMIKNPKHAAVLADSGIQYDNPLAPVDVATRRAERLAKEKLKNAVGASVLTPEQQQAAAARLVQQQQIMAQQGSTAGTPAHQINQSASSVAGGSGVAKTANVAVSPTAAANVKARAAGLHDVRASPTIVTNLQPGQRLSTGNIVASAQGPAVIAQKNIVGYTIPTNAKNLTPAQIQYVKQQQILRQQQQQQQLKVLQAQAGGQKMSVAVSAATAAQQRSAALMKQTGAAGTAIPQQQGASGVKQNVSTRQVSEADMAALLKRQQQQGKTVTQIQVPAQAGLVPGTQVYTQSGLQVGQAGTSGTGSPVATLVKTTGTVPGVRTATAQQIRHLQLHPQILAQRKLPGQKVAQLTQVAGKAGVPTQLIVQQKGGIQSTMTMQQLQQVMKQVQPGTVQQFAHVPAGQANPQTGQVVLAKSPIQTRVIPVSTGALKQTIQVVAASTAQLRQTAPVQGKPIVTTARASPGPSQVRLQTVAYFLTPQHNGKEMKALIRRINHNHLLHAYAVGTFVIENFHIFFVYLIR
ncbi:hypothetical protein QAD02_016044 [Eretmocerus hayati]|uniref:Uncharacterized protein n=1 Tax=Eretmocerus hayati TaxID=131215 RepID=A0ACC2PAC3_9HYME|nr:hypothetical protein QAD02_016044 [Eretmocerus hayati]